MGYDRETVQRYRAETDRTNLRTLERMCLFGMALVVLLLLFYDTLLRQTGRVVVLAVFALFLVMAYLYINSLLKSVSAGPIRGTKKLVYLVSVIMYLFGIVCDTLLSRRGTWRVGAYGCSCWCRFRLTFRLCKTR